MVKAKKFICVKVSEDLFCKQTDFKLVEEELPPLKDGEFLAQAVYLSVDPYMRGFMGRFPLESTMIGSQVALITESRNSNYPVGKYVAASFGWRTHTISNGAPTQVVAELPLTILPDLGELPMSLALGVLGMPGNTAYFGFLELCQPKPGETVVVSGAAGAVGSHVGQIAKIKGCKVIGIAGSDEKGKWLTDELGFDHFINYKTQNVAKALKEAAPQGVDCYFDNVGGETTTTVINQMNMFGRISLCGRISQFNTANPKGIDDCQKVILERQLRVEGYFLVTRWVDRWSEPIEQNLKWIKEGKLKFKETVTEGFPNMVNALNDVLRGKNTEKVVVKV